MAQILVKVNLHSLRSNIGVVIQDTNLFSGTIKDNIGLVLKCYIGTNYRSSNINKRHEFIMDLNNGYDTVIGERGFGLSGGQKD